MKKFVFIISISLVIMSLYGCAKKEQTLEEMQQPMSMETLTTMNNAAPAVADVKAVPEAKVEAVTKATKLEPLPPVEPPYKPSDIQIQTALKNAGFYAGALDGKIGNQSKKAIIEFQKANGLTADGKVGLKTWGVLGKYLNLEQVSGNQSQPR
jgi:hypothetical protein